MKRLDRNPEKFEALEVFTAFSRERGYKLRSQEDTEKFLQVFRDTLKVSQENTILLHGKRMESCFGQVVAGLHGCRLIKTEDTGDVIYDDDEIELPDYRLILKDGRQIFVEVKNCNHSNPKASYLLTKNYVEKLQRYSEINQIPLFFAIYYRCLRMWTLLPVTSFIERKTKYETCTLHSIANSEMAMLGDVMIATKPPLIIELVADNTQEISINDDNYAHFVCGDVKMYCDGEEIIEHNEKNIAFYLMRFGLWECGEPEAVMTQSNTLQSVRYSFFPQSMEGFEKNGFSIIGNLSSMITEAFNEHTVYEQEVTAITSGAEPDVFSVKIPVDYKGSVLGLWRFSLEANPDFKVGENLITE